MIYQRIFHYMYHYFLFFHTVSSPDSESKSLHDMLSGLRLQSTISQKASDLLSKIEMLIQEWRQENEQADIRRIVQQDQL